MVDNHVSSSGKMSFSKKKQAKERLNFSIKRLALNGYSEILNNIFKINIYHHLNF